MCDLRDERVELKKGMRTVPVAEAVGMVLAHDITEIRTGEFKGRAFKKGHIVTAADIEHLRRLGKEHLYVLSIAGDEMHEDEAACALAGALKGEGIAIQGEPKEGKITLLADRDGLLTVNAPLLARFNLSGEVMCATLHTNTVVRKGDAVAGTRALPLIVKRSAVEAAVALARSAGPALCVREMRAPKAGVVITGNEVYYGRIKDAFAPIIAAKVAAFNGEVLGVYYAPDDEETIAARLRELIAAGADLLITSGGMSVDPDDVTRFAIEQLGVVESSYGSAVLPGAMVMVAYVSAEARRNGGDRSAEAREEGGDGLIPVIGIPACGMYHKTTVFDLILPRILAGERIGRKELAELGHGGLCLNCRECRFPLCPFGK